MSMCITQHDFVCTEEQEDQTPQVDQRNLVHTGQPKSQIMGKHFQNPQEGTKILTQLMQS